ncbi:hypothetical protein PENTCL1PPCAC_17488, partial [Pristionchus entomophagus]
ITGESRQDCFVRGSCVKGGNKQNWQRLTEMKKLIDQDCEVIIQIRAYSDAKYHIMMQVNSTKDIDDSFPISSKQGDEQFVCQKKTVKGHRD